MGAELVFFSDDQEEKLTTLAATLGVSPHDAVGYSVDFYATALQAPIGDAVVVYHADREDPEKRFLVATDELMAHKAAASILRYIGVSLSWALIVVSVANGMADSIDNRDWITLALHGAACIGLVVMWSLLRQLYRPEPGRQRIPHQKPPKADPGE